MSRTEPPTRENPPTRSSYDPGPLPADALRVFAPVALGDLQTASSYLENGSIRLNSMIAKGEKFTTFEQRAVYSALRDLAETLTLVRGLLTGNELLDVAPLPALTVKPACWNVAPPALGDQTPICERPDGHHGPHGNQDGTEWTHTGSQAATTALQDGDTITTPNGDTATMDDTP